MKNDTQLHVTTNYDQFKKIQGNRSISKTQVARLTKAIAHKNLLAQNPIIVNERMEVIDGQHRLEVAKANNYPLYYVIKEGLSLDDVVRQNTANMKWAGQDFLASHIEQGNKEYIRLQELMDEFGLTLANALQMFVMAEGGHTLRLFKLGEMKLNEEHGRLVAEMRAMLIPYTNLRVKTDREFILALKQAVTAVSAEHIVERLEASGKQITGRVSTREYLQELEDIVNYNMRERIRLY